MGTLIKNKGLDIEFEVLEIDQSKLEKYEQALSTYLADNNYAEGKEMAVLVSAIVAGGVNAELIPEDVLRIEEIKKSKPSKISFLAARISEIIDACKTKVVDIEFEMNDITQGELEDYEKVRTKTLKKFGDFSIFEIALANRIMCEIGLDVGWVKPYHFGDGNCESLLNCDPAIIKYIANAVSSALVEAKNIPGE